MKVSYISALADVSGYAEAARNYVAALLSVGVNIETVPISFENFKLDLGSLGNKIKKLAVQNPTGDINLIHTTPPVFKKYINKSKINIGFTTWETSSLPKSWVTEINELDAVIVPCSYNVEVFKSSGVTIPIHRIPHTFDDKLITENPLTLQHLNPDDYVFYAISQWTVRKNFLSTLKAYLTEFKQEEKVALIVKTYLTTPGSQTEKEKLKQAIQDVKAKLYLPSYPKILLVSEMLSRQQMIQLHRRGNCCLSFHASEGFGLSMAEAMLAGNPVIATNYGGSTDFLTKDTGFPIAYQLTPVFGMPWENYKGTDNWADINIIDAKEKMRYCFEHQQEAKQIGFQGKEFIHKNFSYEVVGNQFKQVLEQVRKK